MVFIISRPQAGSSSESVSASALSNFGERARGSSDYVGSIPLWEPDPIKKNDMRMVCREGFGKLQQAIGRISGRNPQRLPEMTF